MEINFVDLKKQYKQIFECERFKNGFMDVIHNCMFTGGEPLLNFEKSLCRYCDVGYVVGVGSGTDALIIALRALGIKAGDEVIVPANTYIATAFAVTLLGANVKFIDPDPDTYVITPEIIEESVTSYTKAIIPVHLYGYPCDMENIMKIARKYNLFVVEDCAQAIGARINGKSVGTFGDAGCFSFYPTKNLGGICQGGAVITNNCNIAKFVREVGNVGRKEGSWYDYIHLGLNSRLDTINAFFMWCCIEENALEEWTHKRITIAKLYEKELSDEEVFLPPMPTEEITCVFHLFELGLQNKEARDGLKNYLEDHGVHCGLHYPVPCHKQPIYTNISHYLECPISENYADTLLSLPMHPSMTSYEVKYVCDKIKEYLHS